MISALTCAHGYFLTDCALCLKAPHECDYGSCVLPASSRVSYIRDTRIVETRRMCSEHVPEHRTNLTVAPLLDR